MTSPALRRAVLACTAAALIAAGPARAAACWQADTVGAARISEFNTLLMVTSLRCQRIGIDFRPTYERLVTLYSAALHGAEAKLKAHFGIDHGDGREDYDSYAVGIANYYGGSHADPAACRAFSAIADVLTRARADIDMLATLAMQMVRDPHIGSRCPARP